MGNVSKSAGDSSAAPASVATPQNPAPSAAARAFDPYLIADELFDAWALLRALDARIVVMNDAGQLDEECRTELTRVTQVVSGMIDGRAEELLYAPAHLSPMVTQ